MENYECICQIGKGNFGSIFKISRKSDSKIMVWKELNYGQMTEKEKQQIVSEVNIIRELKHPNIVRYYDRIIDKKNSKIYIIMEYCEGGDIGQVIKRCKRTNDFIQEDVIWKIFSQIVHALSACHNRTEGKILHRDIKPSNIFLDNENNIKLGDFGLSRMLSNESNFAYSHVGTPYYMSPEQIEELKYDDRSDIWSLGCFLYELTALHPPFEAKNHLALATKIKAGNVDKINSKYSDDLWKVLSLMLNVNSNLRPSINDLLNLPQINLRLKEKRIKESLAKIKQIEANLKLKEDELNSKEKELNQRDKSLQEKEDRLNEKEKSLNELSKKLSSIPSTTNLTTPSNHNKNNNIYYSSINSNSNANTNMNSITINQNNEDIDTHHSSTKLFEENPTNIINANASNWMTMMNNNNNTANVHINSNIKTPYNYEHCTPKNTRINRSEDKRYSHYEAAIAENNTKGECTSSFKFDPSLYHDYTEVTTPTNQFNSHREVTITTTKNKLSGANMYYTHKGTPRANTNCNSIEVKSINISRRASTPKLNISNEKIVKSHQRAGSYSTKYVQKSICSVNSVIDRSRTNHPVNQFKQKIINNYYK